LATVRIKSIKEQFVLNKADFEYLQSHYNKDLHVLSLNYTNTGHLWSIAVYARGTDCITLFLDQSKVEYEVNYNGNCNNQVSQTSEHSE
jgi:hypothetical protein